ncbi:hypothetical protein A3C09_02780 [Candidatus Uhrbacteria bacterium RIFCSPHIGHO2_02_FULL_47_44]|uniref:Uncharacterized protein n=1 Tax=Candidatus Uhrbacteria bacterium RIFCSPLOWO2_02_FULL_48_18 TaxID=1802408 RepID=A0A1F7V7D2_9BACT|nr:MAG: hypothetical protein A3C09_02780 [Candidatus Uhrbacteria bacterium RIFCSPHIGHO2_02_FULL_47_44]OGL77244.1 MAG: hypothetical protein A3E97_01075 [Candidatus Uhrbacteria bacterium RIFCSPHIGHO2_12_FULL_47_12]OGL80471.1 MAG: hypothetical protein A3B20_03625 [Candidatus Uhrbacteria bacterium RIFCSPLOWO2_01_FULL_47_17]OGL86331.1 MAG: hypothetical protein A3I41_02105 [Candidatus Uhrbacteria bacterium RIFCSPLOWO2_02_FULL_48_18]OGL93049.1 MAG: hypothetical protein A3H12_01300 [Candidatus Uhrbacte
MLRELREYIPPQVDNGKDQPKKEYTEYPGGLNRAKVEKQAKAKITDQVRREEVKRIVQESAHARRQEREVRVPAFEQAQADLKKSKNEGQEKTRIMEADLKAKGIPGDVEHALLKRARLQATRGDEGLRARVGELSYVGKRANETHRTELRRQPNVIRRAVSERVEKIEAQNGVSAEATRMIQEAKERARRLASSKESKI